jgi:hypothetical protein
MGKDLSGSFLRSSLAFNADGELSSQAWFEIQDSGGKLEHERNTAELE